MGNHQLARIFGMLHSLERITAQNKQAIHSAPEPNQPLARSQREQEKIVGQMRRSANLLQLAIASNNPNQIAKQLQVFYGLHFLVKDEIFQTLRKVSAAESSSHASAPLETHPKLPVSDEKHTKWH